MNLNPQQIMLIRECTRDDLCFAKMLDLYLEFAKGNSDVSPADLEKKKAILEAHPKPKPSVAPDAPLIAIVDDSVSLLDIVGRILEHEGYRILALHHPLPLFESDHPIPDLILLDIEMPEMNGAVALDRLKIDSRYQKTKVVFMTGLVSEEEATQLSLPGKISYLSKPFTREKLAAKIKEVLPSLDHLSLSQK